jgi:PadR family transcriptional regulator PadR
VSPRPLGYATLAVLKALAEGHRYGFDVIDHTGLPSGTVYPALSTLNRRKLVESAWEEPDRAQADGRPRRRYYELTTAGRAMLRESLERLEDLGLATVSPARAGASK